jgi:hypothetical protein
VESTVQRGSDEIRPVYPVDAGAPDPLAARFCDVVLLEPERRRAECCSSSSAVASTLRDQCVRTLTFALGQHAVTLAPADVDRCADAVTRATSACDWVIPNTVALPPECEGIVKGALKEKDPCRSSLECPDGMRCVGLSTVDFGACGAPKAARSPCNLAVDMLATFTRQDQLDRAHPECAGYCGHGRCEDRVAPGGTCSMDRACGQGHCSAGKCTDKALPAAGSPCTDACAAGARCVKGQCAAPRSEGGACESDVECRGQCVRGDAGAVGACVKSCPGSTIPASSVPARPGAPPSRRR